MQALVEKIQTTFQKHHDNFMAADPPLSPPCPANPPPAKVLKEKKEPATPKTPLMLKQIYR